MQTQTKQAITTSGLTRRYGKITAVEGLNLSVNKGEVYGFLGPNGAGKTTTLRMLLGLVKPTSGEAEVLGAPAGAFTGLSKTGALIESPAFYPYLSGEKNLRIMAGHTHGMVPEGRIGEVLDRVGLKSRAKDKYKKYSLGMKQRLGVAAALMKDPELLILDEPTNGLDPQGMADMRELIRAVSGGDRAVLLSSHLMNEVEQVCDRVGVISKGKLVTEGTVSELRGEEGLVIRAEPLDKAERVARQLREVESVRAENGELKVTADPDQGYEISQQLDSAGVKVSEMRRDRRSLEDVFLELTGEEHEEHEGQERHEGQESQENSGRKGRNSDDSYGQGGG